MHTYVHKYIYTYTHTYIHKYIHTYTMYRNSFTSTFMHTTCFDTVIPSSEEMSVHLTQTTLSEVAYMCVHVMLTAQFEVKILLKPKNGCVPSTVLEIVPSFSLRFSKNASTCTCRTQ